MAAFRGNFFLFVIKEIEGITSQLRQYNSSNEQKIVKHTLHTRFKYKLQILITPWKKTILELASPIYRWEFMVHM
jgi:hypothetical protein